MEFRQIEEKDNAAIAKIIRENLKANKLDIPGTVYFDTNLNHLSDFYLDDTKKRAYYVITENDEVLGGAGFAEFEGKENCAELQKLYLADKAKGKGLGYEMIHLVEEKTKELAYQTLYLETHTNLQAAIHIYEKYGFRQIERPKSVAHSTMNRFYELDLNREK